MNRRSSSDSRPDQATAQRPQPGGAAQPAGHARPRPDDAAPKTPWWRVGMVWLVLSGPLAAVVAGSVTAYIAVSGADTVIDTRGERGAPQSTAPAVQGRNHVVTPQPQ